MNVRYCKSSHFMGSRRVQWHPTPRAHADLQARACKELREFWIWLAQVDQGWLRSPAWNTLPRCFLSWDCCSRKSTVDSCHAGVQSETKDLKKASYRSSLLPVLLVYDVYRKIEKQTCRTPIEFPPSLMRELYHVLKKPRWTSFKLYKIRVSLQSEQFQIYELESGKRAELMVGWYSLCRYAKNYGLVALVAVCFPCCFNQRFGKYKMAGCFGWNFMVLKAFEGLVMSRLFWHSSLLKMFSRKKEQMMRVTNIVYSKLNRNQMLPKTS